MFDWMRDRRLSGARLRQQDAPLGVSMGGINGFLRRRRSIQTGTCELPVLPDHATVATAQIRVKLYPNPFRLDAEERWFPSGLSIAEGLATLGLRRYRDCTTVVWLNDCQVPEPWFGCVRPKPYTCLTVRPIPRGGTVRTVLFAVATIVAAFFGQYYVGPALFGSGGAAGLLDTFSVGTPSALTTATAAGLERRFRARQHTRAVARAKRYHLPVFDWRRAHDV